MIPRSHPLDPAPTINPGTTGSGNEDPLKLKQYLTGVGLTDLDKKYKQAGQQISSKKYDSSIDPITGKPKQILVSEDEAALGDPVTHRSIAVFNEGFGGRNGLPKKRDYWLMEAKGKTPDTTVFTHYNEKVRRFFELGGYRAFPEVVTVQLEIREVLAVDVVRGTFRVSFIATTRWYDKFFDREEFFDQQELFTTTKPYITFDHVDEGDDPQGVPQDAAPLPVETKHSGRVQRKTMDPPGVLYHSQRVQCSFRVQNDLTKFPFDVQQLKMVVRLWGSSVKDNMDHGRILLPLTVNM